MGSEADIQKLTDELLATFGDRGLTREQARGLAEFIGQRTAKENERYNAYLLSRVLMRLGEADPSRVVAMSLAFAVSIPHVGFRGKLLDPRKRGARAEAARLLGVSPDTFSRAVRRSRECLGLLPEPEGEVWKN